MSTATMRTASDRGRRTRAHDRAVQDARVGTVRHNRIYLGQRALEHLRHHRYDFLLTDLMMPEMDGITFLRSAQAIDPNLSAIMMTGHGTIDTAVKSLQSGALDYVLKPFRLDNLLSVLTRRTTMRRLQVENRELQQRIQERSRELEASNAELESFSYSVSHDLRAPLRAIDGFATLFIQEYASQVPPEGLDFLANIIAGTARMQRLIDDLLHLARFSRQPLEMHTVSMQDLVRRVLATLQHQWPERARHLEIGELPECRGDRSLLEHVLTNLLSNALKFTATRDPRGLKSERTRRTRSRSTSFATTEWDST